MNTLLIAALPIFAILIFSTGQLLWIVWRIRRIERCVFAETRLNGKVVNRRCWCTGENVP